MGQSEGGRLICRLKEVRVGLGSKGARGPESGGSRAYLAIRSLNGQQVVRNRGRSRVWEDGR